jgi:hypothetical protein
MTSAPAPNALSRLLARDTWARDRRLSPAILIALATFGILALELALIRWTSSQIRVFAYFNNLVLIGTFLGMGLGVALGRTRPGLVYLILPALCVIALPLAFSDAIGLVHLRFPDRSVSLWGGARFDANWFEFARNLTVFLAIFTGIVGVFVCAGAALGHLFPRLPTLRAYSADLLGSLVGIVAFSLAAWLQAGPAVWLALGALPFLILARGVLGTVLTVVVIGLGQYSVQGAVFSPYNRIALHTDTPFSLELEVNRDFHQYLHDFSAQRLADPALTPANRGLMEELAKLYALPFSVNAKRGSAVVVGAGTGNDVQAALRAGYREVTSVDIDPRIIAIGRSRHPEQPYSNPGVRIIVDDARSFFSSDRGQYDVVCFGLLDSHAMASAMSTLRLDNYVYTEEGIRAAWNHVAPGGHLSLAISCTAGRWFFERLYWTITRATGREPIAFYSPLHGATATFVVPRSGAALVTAELAARPQIKPESPQAGVLTPSDDWPFLYVRPGAFPWGYLVVLAYVLVLALVTVPRAFAMRGGGDFDVPLFLMGAAFLLIETRGVTSMSLLFGSTWIVNAVIFSGILAMVLIANLIVERRALTNPTPWFIGLFLAMLLLYLFPVAALQAMPIGARILVAAVITGLPVGFAGLIVPMLLARSSQPAAALGANLLGAVLGGCLEYYSMLGGLKSTALMALVLYLGAFVWLRRRTSTAMVA